MVGVLGVGVQRLTRFVELGSAMVGWGSLGWILRERRCWLILVPRELDQGFHLGQRRRLGLRCPRIVVRILQVLEWF